MTSMREEPWAEASTFINSEIMTFSFPHHLYPLHVACYEIRGQLVSSESTLLKRAHRRNKTSRANIIAWPVELISSPRAGAFPLDIIPRRAHIQCNAYATIKTSLHSAILIAPHKKQSAAAQAQHPLNLPQKTNEL